MAQWTNLQRIEKFENRTRLYITCGKSGGLYLAEPRGWLAGWQFGRRNLGEARDFKCLLQIEIFDYLLCLARYCIISTTLMHCKRFFKINTATRLFYGV